MQLDKADKMMPFPDHASRDRTECPNLTVKVETQMPSFSGVTEMSFWSQSIGGLVINFGGLEFQTFRWIQLLGGETAAIEARGKNLSKRIDEVLRLLTNSNMAAETQLEVRGLWNEVKELAKIRNRIAHNPLCLGRDTLTNELSFSVIDLKKMQPVGDNILERLSHKEIAEAAVRARDINRLLSTIVEKKEF